MIIKLFKKRASEFSTWWKSPSTKKARSIAMMVGAFGGFWIGLLVKLIFGALPASFTEVGMWALCGAVFFSLLGLAFPKVVTCVCFPFSTFGVGN